MQVGFEYNYTSSNDIIQAASDISHMWIIEYISFFWVIVLLYGSIYYLLPLLSIVYKYYKREQEKAKRKLMLRQISLQKDIEDEIEAEIEKTAQQQS